MNNLPKVKNVPVIDATQLKAFMKFLPEDVRLLVETYKFASEAYAWIGLSYRWIELFRLPASAVVDDGIQPTIRLERSSRYGSRGEAFFALGLPLTLARKLVALARKHADGLLFRQKDGKPFDSMVLAQEFFQASDRAYEKKTIKKHLVPRVLQAMPRSDITVERGSVPSISFRHEFVKTISEEKVYQIANLISACRAGRLRVHSLRAVLQALLAQEDFNLTRDEFRNCFPVIWSAAESQKRRWKDLWPRILEILDS